MRRFSARTNWNLAETQFSRAVREFKEDSRVLLDLTASNPTACGFEYPIDTVVAGLGKVEGFRYEPVARGQKSARMAVGEYYAGVNGEGIDAERIFLTTSTSEAYGYLFRLLCEVGDAVMIAQPSYPLFEFLVDLSDVSLVEFPYFYDHGWHVDLAALEATITPRCRAILLVHPNNPTGHFIKREERAAIEAICERHGLALIVDEVFLDYRLEGRGRGEQGERSFAGGENRVLTFVLSGLSKVAGLPQMKVAWIVCGGPEIEVSEAMGRLEVIADTYLSINTPMQVALPGWLEGRQGIQGQIRARVEGNLEELDRVLMGSMVSRLEVEGGWYAVLRVPALADDEAAAIALLRETGVLVHPGHFYGFHGNGWMVVSLLAEAGIFAEAAGLLVRFFSKAEVRQG